MADLHGPLLNPGTLMCYALLVVISYHMTKPVQVSLGEYVLSLSLNHLKQKFISI